MNVPNDLERDMTRWMAAVVPTKAPDALASAIVAQTRSMRPRPRWLARLLEPSMQTSVSLRRDLGFGRSPRLTLVALLVIALVVGVVVAGSLLIRPRSLPPPFGVAGNGLIAADVGGSIKLLAPDGSLVRRVDLPYDDITRMSFSRDGTRLAAWWTPDPGQSSRKGLIVANVDGSAAAEVGIDRFSTWETSRLAWSPDDRRIAFSDGQDRLFVADLASGTFREVAVDPEISKRRDPAWSPDGRLAYRCRTQDHLALCLSTADLASERVLPTSRGTDFAFQGSSWSHDGKFIAYYVDDVIDHPAASAGFDVAVIDPQTGTERILTVGTADHMILPVWTPDGRHILALGAIIATDGTGVRLIGDGRCSWTEPSPDGRFAMCLADGRQVELWPIAGGPPTVLPLDDDATLVSWQRLGG